MSDAFGNGRRRLVPYGGNLDAVPYNARWSHDGTRIAFMYAYDIWVVNTDGSGLRALTTLGGRVHLNSPVWFPDDSKIYFSGAYAGTNYVTSDGAAFGMLSLPVSGLFVEFSPDGTKVAVAGRATSSDPSGIYTMNIDGSELRLVTDGAGGRDVEPRWSSDGKRLVFTNFSMTNTVDVVVMNADGTGRTIIRRNAYASGWSPDGSGVLVLDSSQPPPYLRMVHPDGSGGVRVGGCSPLPVRADWHASSQASSGSPHSWGWNGFGQLGDGTTTDRRSPVSAPPLSGVVAESGGSFHSLALRDDGTVWAWGWNGSGQLGDGTTVDRQTPVQVRGLSDVTCVSAGTYHSVAVRGDGTVWAWGWNHFGQLGDGTTQDRRVPVPVTGLSNVGSVSAGAFHNVALRADGSAWSWGWNALGQLGDGSKIDRAAPVAIAGFGSIPIPGGGSLGNRFVVSIVSGMYHALAVTGDGFVFSWGWNYFGQLGDGSTVDRSAPSIITGLDQVALAAGAYHSSLLGPDGAVWSWGWNGFGQLGDGTTQERHRPVRLSALTSVVSVSLGWFHSAAVKTDGTVSAWGWNTFGQLGDGTAVDQHSPSTVSGVGGVIAAACGGLHSLVF